MKKMTLGLLLCWVAMQGMAAEKVTWLTDLPKAQAQAKKENKLVLMDFTGSDWCPWCVKLHDNVFSKKEFAKYAKAHLVLVELDFPQKKEQPEDLKKANKALGDKYNPDGEFPTIIVLDGDGKQLGKLQYEETPKDFIAKIETLKK